MSVERGSWESMIADELEHMQVLPASSQAGLASVRRRLGGPVPAAERPATIPPNDASRFYLSSVASLGGQNDA